MLKSVFFLMIFTLAGHTNNLMDLGMEQLELNGFILHESTQKEIQRGELSQDSLSLIKQSSALKNTLGLAQSNTIDSTSYCGDPTDPKKKSKKSKNKLVNKKGWQIISSVQYNKQNNGESFESLESPLSVNEYNSMYVQLLGVTTPAQLKEVIGQHTQKMSENEFISYLSEMTDRLPYNDSKANFTAADQGVDGLYQMLGEHKGKILEKTAPGNSNPSSTDWGGICGDIHFATSLMGEAGRGDDYEFFTASYVTDQNQHVYSFAVSKENPNKAFVVNYGSAYAVDKLSGVDSVLIKDSKKGRFDNIGARVRIFTNTDNSPDGKSEHVATLPTALGRYLQKVHGQDQRVDSIAALDNSTTASVNFKKDREVIKTKDDKKKVINISKGLKLMYGSLGGQGEDNTDVISVAAYIDRTKNNGKLTNESSLSLSGSVVSQDESYFEKNIYLRLNYYKGVHKKLIDTDRVTVKANAGMTVSADMVKTKNGLSGDGDFKTELGVNSKFKVNPKNNFKFDLGLGHNVGLKEERRLYERDKIASNVKLTANVVKARAQWSRSIADKNRVSLSSQYTGTQVGALVDTVASYEINAHKEGTKQIITVNYLKPMSGFNKDIKSNLLFNREQLGLGYGVKYRSMEAGANLKYDIKSMRPFLGGSLKFNIDRKKRRPSSRP